MLGQVILTLAMAQKGVLDETNRRRAIGWGWKDVAAPEDRVKQLLASLSILVPPLHSHSYAVPDAEDLSRQLRDPRFSLPPSLFDFCTSDRLDRLRHSHGQSYIDTVRSLTGDVAALNPPDYVAYPTTTAQVEKLLAFCSRKNFPIAVVPYGGGTSVVGGARCPTSAEWPHDRVIVVDVRTMNRLLAVDQSTLTVHVEAGVTGPQLAELLRPHGLCFRHYPQSWEFSTVGGWVATRAGGHFATGPTRIDHFVAAITMVTPAGAIRTRHGLMPPVPSSGAGPALDSLWIGSEGALGIVTDVVLRVQRLVVAKISACVSFTSFESGCEAAKNVLQAGLSPAMCRLIDERESMLTGLGNSCVLLLGFESSEKEAVTTLNESLQLAVKLAEHAGGKRLEKADGSVSADDPATADPDMWRDSFLRMPYVRDELTQHGYIAETLETCCAWSSVAVLRKEVTRAALGVIKGYGGTGFVTCRLTHAYTDGAAPYFTVIASSHQGEQTAEWLKVKHAATLALQKAGGTVTHHHAVGRDHQPYYETEYDALTLSCLEIVKSTLDSAHIMNPGTLLHSKL